MTCCGKESKITDLKAREIIDSRGQPTVEVDLYVGTCKFRASVPSGASTGVYEAVELRDGDKSRFEGKGVLKAVENVVKLIKPAVMGMDVMDQEKIDQKMVELDGTKNEWGSCKSKLGANAILGVSLAVCRAAARFSGKPVYEYVAKLAGQPVDKMYMPVPCLNVINGGRHAGNLLPMQEFMIVPTGAPTFREAIRMGCEVQSNLKSIVKEKYGLSAGNVGDEGGVAPMIETGEQALDLLVEAIEKAKYTGKVKIGMDVAASEFYDEKEKKYNLDVKNQQKADKKYLTGDQMVEMYIEWTKKYPIVFIEDPFDQDDFSSWAKITAAIGADIPIIGDDLCVTNIKRIEKAVEQKACNALLLKVNQIGTITEAIQAVKLAYSHKWKVLGSHRSGETEDTFLADLVVGLGTKQLKTGAVCRGERTSKYNELMRIEEELGSRAVYSSENFKK